MEGGCSDSLWLSLKKRVEAGKDVEAGSDNLELELLVLSLGDLLYKELADSNGE